MNKMNNLFSCNNDPYNLRSIIINKLSEMNVLLQQKKIEESIDLARDIALIWY